MKRGKTEGRGRSGRSKESGSRNRPPAFPPPLKPRKKLLIALAVAFAGWVGVLLTLYFTTVYPGVTKQRSQYNPPTPKPETRTMNE